MGFHERVDAFTGAIHSVATGDYSGSEAEFDVLAPTAERVVESVFDGPIQLSLVE